MLEEKNVEKVCFLTLRLKATSCGWQHVLQQELFVNNNLEVCWPFIWAITFWKGQHKDFHSQRENIIGSWHVPESGSGDTVALCYVHPTMFPEVTPKKNPGLERYSFLRRLLGFCCWSFALTLNSWNYVRSTKVKQETQRPWLFWKSSAERINNFTPFKVLTTILLHSSTFLTEGLVTY